MILGAPNIQIKFVDNAFAIVVDSWFGKGTASKNFEINLYSEVVSKMSYYFANVHKDLVMYI